MLKSEQARIGADIRAAPASHESAGRRRPAGTRQGAPWLRRTLIEAARAAARTRDSYFSAQYARIAKRRGPNKAAVAVAHSILAVVWHLLTDGALYQDPGADYFQRRHDPAVEAKRLQRRVEALGYQVTLTETAAQPGTRHNSTRRPTDQWPRRARPGATAGNAFHPRTARQGSGQMP